VDRDGDARPEDLGRFGRPVARQRQVRAIETVGALHRARVQDGHVDVAEPLRDAPHHVERRVVARYVDGLQPRTGEHEADHRTGEVVRPVGAVLRRRSGDGHGAPVSALDLDRRPRLQPRRVAAQALGALDRRQHAPRARQELAPGRIEVVAVMLVGQKHHVDRDDRLRVERRTGRLHEAALVLAGRRQRRIGEPAQAGVLEDGGGSPDELGGQHERSPHG
jgi:hypothetical protein